ncbi:uncharacterized protein LY89DRAFT_668355 [Mollisia scopiformis]|uniref:Uncharacterized protein n=1 Tax=Mollisia scopiformis TaxID=149040 RepID=A0A194XEJ0_MOLSC|nr:uncharacterized protein LY89DRAFT_668355 [Mollisia scopiformis]KUJ18172.1 hypothetical protein LY89DRAFT_668355 [Mollisia scopiformis]
MNWTGGRLQRSTAASGVKHQQKQHFAKVAQNLRSGSKFKSPVKWSVFDLIAEDRERGQRESPAAHQVHVTSNREQSRLLAQHHTGLYPNAHVAGKRESSKTNTSSAYRVNSHISRTNNRIKPSPVPVPARVPDDDLYNATPPPPPPRNIKQQREESVPLSEIDSFVEPKQEQESVFEKRRRVLRRGDWVGVGIQKPLQIAFASPRDEENIGRRRKIPTGGHRARYETKQTHITSPFPQRARCPANIAPSAWAKQLRQIEAEKADVRISIGGKVVPPGLSSSSAPRTAIHNRSQATPSDVMLLDDDVFQGKEKELPSNVVHNYIHFSRENSQNTYQAPEIAQMQIGLPSDDYQIQQHLEDFQSWAGISPNDDFDRDSFDEELLREPDTTPFRVQELAEPVDPHNGMHPGQVVFSSSSTSIHHPKPQSSRVSVLIRSDSSESAQSTKAQVGKRREAVPSSQVDENKLWESWIAPLYQESSQDTNGFGDERYRTNVSISPGISVLLPRRPFEAHPAGQNEDISDSVSPENQEGTEEPLFERAEVQSSTNGDQHTSEDYESSRLLEHQTTDAEAESYPTSRKSSRQTEKPTAVVESKEKDADESWRKFVFGSSSSDTPEEHGSKTRQITSNWKDHQETASSSMLAHPATRQSIDSTCEPEFPGSHSFTSRITSNVSKNEPRVEDYSTASESQDLSASSSSSRSESNHPSASVAFGKKIVFTKPKPIVGRKSMEPSTDEGPLHIGRHLLDDDTKSYLGQSRSVEQEVYSTATSTDEDDVESIEDD